MKSFSFNAVRFFSAKKSKLFTLSRPVWETHNLPKDVLPPTKVNATQEDLLKYYYEMHVIRRVEIVADSLYKRKLIRGFCHLYLGQEAIAVGLKSAMTPADSLITAYRCHGFAWTRGRSITEIFAELLGKGIGVSKGKGGSMHLFGENFYGGNGIVGAQVPVGTGLAFAHKYRGEKNVTAILYGDGAANQGQVFEAFNMAKLWNLPAIFICENNMFGMGTSAVDSSASTQYYKRGDYIPGMKVDGMDVLAVKEAMIFAKDWANSGKGPLVLEMDTYRYSGHSMSDPGTSYRTRNDIQKIRDTRDSIYALEKLILEAEFATEAELKEIVKKARAEVEEAENNAIQASEPDVTTLFKDVYVPGSEPSEIRGRVLEETYYF